MAKTLQEFINAHTITLSGLEKKARLAWWNLATTGDPVYSEEYRDLQIAIKKMYSSSKDYQFLRVNQNSTDPLLKRQAALLLNDYTENQIPQTLIEQITQLESDIESIYTNFRPIINETPLSSNDLKKILVESTDSKQRKEAWEASKLIGEQVEEKIYQLIALRNDSAKRVGFSDYYSMRLQLQELDQDRLFELIDQMEKSTASAWKTYKQQLDQTLAAKYGIKSAHLMPWHYCDPFFQEAPQQDLDLDRFYQNKNLVALGSSFFQEINLPVEDILNRSDLHEREKKNQHAFCICLDRKEDVRILCNLRPNEYWMGTLLHELGHGVYDKYLDQRLPYLLRIPAHISTTEAIAMLFGRLSKFSPFLHKYCGVDRQTADNLSQKVQQHTAASLLVFARWALVMIHFERLMYQQPGSDLNHVWWDCVERFQGLSKIPNRNKPDWASKLHLACAPVYYQNYILGEMTASQLQHNLQKIVSAQKDSFVSSKLVGNWLQDKLFSLGAQHPWEETLKRVTGEPLNPNYFSADVSRPNKAV